MEHNPAAVATSTTTTTSPTSHETSPSTCCSGSTATTGCTTIGTPPSQPHSRRFVLSCSTIVLARLLSPAIFLVLLSSLHFAFVFSSLDPGTGAQLRSPMLLEPQSLSRFIDHERTGPGPTSRSSTSSGSGSGSGSGTSTIAREGGRQQEPPRNTKSTKLSLWLVPPGAEAGNDNSNGGIFGRTKGVIDDLSTSHAGPRFSPHITIAGGIVVGSDDEATALGAELTEKLSGFGPVDCVFGEVARSAPDCWNQALVLEVLPSESFLRLWRTCREILPVGTAEESDSERTPTFPPPLGIPHMSLYYGEEPPEPSGVYLSRIFGANRQQEHSFRAHRVMLWKTDPSTAEGVPEWEPLADLDLL